MYLDDQKKAEKVTEAKRKAEVMHRELEELKLKKRKMEQVTTMRLSDADRRPEKSKEKTELFLSCHI